MPKLNTNFQINGRNFSSNKSYTESINVSQEVDNTDGFIEIVSFSSTKGTNVLSGSKGLCIYNQSNVASEIQVELMDWVDSSNTDIANSVDLGPGSATTGRYVTFLLPALEYIYFPSSRFLSYAEDASAANAVVLDNVAPDANMYTDLDADGLNEAVDGSETEIDVDDLALYKVGDLLRVENEIMEVTAKATEDGAGALTVLRGQYGSSAATHTDSQAVRLAFFNTTADFDKYSTTRTDANGALKITNLMGYGRNLTGVADGFVPGSFNMKFYNQAYQELGLSGISLNTDTGLTAGTTYYFKIAVDGGSAFEVAVTIDSSNTKFGGANGFISKIQAILDTQATTGGSALLNKQVIVGIVNGDLRFTSLSRLSSSAVALTTGTTGNSSTNLIGNAIGVFPADVEAPVSARLPEDVLYDKATYDSIPNTAVFAFDDGNANIRGVANGTINYETGALDIVGPPNAEFVFSVAYQSAHSGGVSTASNNFNSIQKISARSCNNKIPTTVEVIGYN